MNTPIPKEVHKLLKRAILSQKNPDIYKSLTNDEIAIVIMPLLKQVVKTEEIIEQAEDLLKKAIEQVAPQTRAELERSVQELSKEMREIVVNDLATALESIKKTDLENRELLSEKIKSYQSELDRKFDTFRNDMRSNERTTLRMVQQQIEDLKESIEEYDDAEIKSLIENLREEMPEAYDATEIKEEIEELEKEIEELKKRPIGNTQGGVTNARIIQAFKYILKTEVPAGDIDGVNTTYTLSQPIFAILAMSINGETVAQLPNYTISGNTFTFSSALPAVYSGKDFEVKYV